jgi:hypothetical protein
MQLVLRVELVGLKVRDLLQLSVELLDLVEVLLELNRVKRLQLLKPLP